MKSQFHYGSIHTKEQYITITTSQLVSIPLWFDSYYYKFELNDVVILSLNSTMVRFILSHRNKPGKANEGKVSIPLWFDSYMHNLRELH